MYMCVCVNKSHRTVVRQDILVYKSFSSISLHFNNSQKSLIYM